MSGKSRKPTVRRRKRAIRDPHAAVVDALILATGRPNSRNRRRLAAAHAELSARVTVALFGTDSTEPLVGVA